MSWKPMKKVSWKPTLYRLAMLALAAGYGGDG